LLRLLSRSCVQLLRLANGLLSGLVKVGHTFGVGFGGRGLVARFHRWCLGFLGGGAGFLIAGSGSGLCSSGSLASSAESHLLTSAAARSAE
jgi:hypothetical protein